MVSTPIRRTLTTIQEAAAAALAAIPVRAVWIVVLVLAAGEQSASVGLSKRA